MSLDVASIKQKEANAGNYQKPLSQGVIAAIGGFTVSFTTLLKRASTRIDSGLDLLSQQGGISGVQQRTDPIEQRETPAADRRSDRGERTDDRRGDRHDDRQRVKRTDRRDERDAAPVDRRRDDSVDAADDRDDGALDRKDASGRSDKSSKKDSNRASKSSDESGNNRNAAADGADGQNTAVTATGETQQTATAAQNGDANAAVLGNGRANAELLLNGLIAQFQAGQVPQQANKQVLGEWLSDANRDNAIEALTKALTQVMTAVMGEHGQGGGAGATTLAFGNFQSFTGDLQIDASTIEQALQKSGVAQQAANLAAMLGEGQSLTIEVTITEETTILISKPGSGISCGIPLLDDDGKPMWGNNILSSSTSQTTLIASMTQTTQAAISATSSSNQTANAQVQQGQVQGPQAIDAKAQAQNSGPAGASQHNLQAGNDAANVPQAAATGDTQQSQQTQQSAPAKQAQAQQQAMPKFAVVEQVSVKIMKAVQAGADKINIQLRPAHLGRIEVQMEMTHDGRVMAVVVADNSDTLDMLKRDQSSLAKSLQDAGLKLEAGDLNFNLREQNHQAQEGGNGRKGRADAGSDAGIEEQAAGLDGSSGAAGSSDDAPVRRYGYLGRRGVDIRA